MYQLASAYLCLLYQESLKQNRDVIRLGTEIKWEGQFEKKKAFWFLVCLVFKEKSGNLVKALEFPVVCLFKFKWLKFGKFVFAMCYLWYFLFGIWIYQLLLNTADFM